MLRVLYREFVARDHFPKAMDGSQDSEMKDVIKYSTLDDTKV